jgi:outer membrane receptor protein involved in Fe transport
MEARVTAGARIDYVGMNVIDDADKLAAVGINSEISPLSAADIWGTDEVNQHELLGLGYLALDAEIQEGWTAGAGLGYGERAPNLTERYAIETFMFLIQNGLNTITGDPSLEKERLMQADLRMGAQAEDARGEVRIFHAWVHDYITYEALSAVPGPPFGQIEQLNLKYVNTDLATLWGCEARADFDWREGLTPFVTVKYVEGEDRTRNGSFDTQPATPGSPSVRVPGVRGTGSGTGVVVGDNEPLPSILPLESRIGLRWEERRDLPRWGVEIAARIVDNQNRVAASLLETPTPGFTVYDLRTFWRPTDGFQLVGGVENFTDKQFREHLDFRSMSGFTVFRPGINFYVGSVLTY